MKLATYINGSAVTAALQPAERVIAFKWGSQKKQQMAIPGAEGNWSMWVPNGEFSLTYLRSGFKPVTHGPYQFGEVDLLADKVVSTLLFNGDDGSTVITDESGIAWSTHGGAKLTSAKKYNGNASLACGPTGFAKCKSSSAFDFGSGDFCVHGAAQLPSAASLSNSPTIISKRKDYSSNGRAWIELWLSNTGTLEVGLAASATAWGLRLSSPAPVARDSWFTWDIARSGNTVRMFINGKVVATGTFTGALYFDQSDVLIGCDPGPGAGSEAYFWLGLLDEMQVTKGAARHVSDYLS